MARNVLSSTSQTDPPFLAPKELIFTFAGQKGLNRLDEIWYQTWIFVVNLEIKSDFRGDLLRTLLGLLMTVERMECTDATGLDAVTK
jgi:hypothetical protein